jgi:mannose-1-phosphate guanylyltransferase
MQAVILVGGEGTRLRPLTSTIPKPVVPLVDRPFIAFMLECCASTGIEDVIMSCGFLATSVRNACSGMAAVRDPTALRGGARPARHGGALKYAESMLDEALLMLNGMC